MGRGKVSTHKPFEYEEFYSFTKYKRYYIRKRYPHLSPDYIPPPSSGKIYNNEDIEQILSRVFDYLKPYLNLQTLTCKNIPNEPMEMIPTKSSSVEIGYCNKTLKRVSFGTKDQVEPIKKKLRRNKPQSVSLISIKDIKQIIRNKSKKNSPQKNKKLKSKKKKQIKKKLKEKILIRTKEIIKEKPNISKEELKEILRKEKYFIIG